MDDLALLKAYAESGSDEAFRTLASRHVAVVYSAARRQVGESLAADVTQAVFILLARKAAKLNSKTILTAWLLTTTRLVCRATLRKELRRRHYEQEAAHMPQNEDQIEIESAWERVAPRLDDALAALSEKDRGLVALRFFEQKSHADIAAKLGLSEEASKKRLSRAVERLRAFFAKRGIRLGAVTLLAAISQHAVQAAPAGLASQITVAASGAGASATAAALVKTTLKFMTYAKLKLTGAAAAGVLVVASIPVIATLGASKTTGITQVSGRPATIERYEFQPGAVRYTYPPSTTNPAVEISRPAFAGDSLLSAEFSWLVGPNLPEAFGMRVAAADESGNQFDPVVQHSAGGEKSGDRQYWVGEVPVFPRRGKNVVLQVLINNGTPLAEFKIPNPAPGPYPQWRPDPLPVDAADGDLRVSLVKFLSHKGHPDKAPYPRTECDFSLTENGRPTVTWVPVAFEISDATGNHWEPSRNDGPDNPYRAKVEDGRIRSDFLGALWPGESAWKLRVGFNRTSEFPENELLRISGIRIPGANELSRPNAQYQFNGVSVQVVGVIGMEVGQDESQFSHRPNQLLQTRSDALINAMRTKGCITVVLGGDFLARDRRLTFIQAADERGDAIELAGLKESSGAFSFVFPPPEGAHELNLTVAVSRTRYVEFLAKPEYMPNDPD